MADRKSGATARGRSDGSRGAAPQTPTAPAPPRVRHDVTLLTDDDLYLFNEGTHYKLYDKLGSHVLLVDEQPGTYFAVWAPDAERVAVMGDFNGWSPEDCILAPRGSSGIWEGFIPGVGRGTRYKYHIWSRFNGFRVDKADPFALLTEEPPLTASIVWDTWYEWQDEGWMAERGRHNALDAPFATYELHLGSWMRGENNRVLSYREVAPRLVEYLTRMGFTHVEFMPVMEHPFGGSWGYQVTGYFAPSARFGAPQDFMYLVQELHRAGIGVILDWVPSHFPGDVHGLVYFDGTHLYEHADPRQGFHPDWASYIFNYSRNEIRSFLGSSAVFWLDRYHADGLRVDAVASMLYLDYSRQAGEWIPNEYGGRENLGAINFLRNVNAEVYREFPDVQTVAEESTAWPMVSRPTYVGGLGFGMKWDMGWMHDTLNYMANDPVHRRWHHGELTFRMIYAFNENFVLPLSHDEVVHGKGSLLARMPGDEWQQFANLRLLFGYMWAQPGKKLLFMGGEFGQGREWSHDHGLDWHLLEYANHQGVQRFMQQLNAFYRSEPALWQLDFSPQGFEWVDANDNENSVLAFLRKGREPRDQLLCLFNFTPVPRQGYRVGVPLPGLWHEVLNSDAPEYYGGGMGNMGAVQSQPQPCHGRPHCLEVTLPPLAALFLRAPREESA